MKTRYWLLYTRPDSPQSPVKITEPLPLPRYTGRRVAVCPETGTDLEQEFDAWWCPACQTTHPFSYVAFPGDIDEPERDD